MSAPANPWRQRGLGVLLALAIFAIDQAIKLWVQVGLDLYHVRVVEVVPVFAFRWVENYGVSLGLLTSGSMEGRFALIGLTGCIALFVTVWMLRERKLGEILALGMVLGGALGNIRDRWERGFVIDYADLHFGDFRPFMVFNFADAAITIGVLIILARSLFSREKPEADTRPAAGELN